MSNQWLAVQSFQQGQDLLAAINTLVIHLKLKLMGVGDEERAEAVEKAKVTLFSFLKTLDKVVRQVEQGNGGPLTGIDPRLRQLAKNFVIAKQGKPRLHLHLCEESPLQVAYLLKSTEPDKQEALIKSLAELRTLLEEHISNDTTQILAEI